MISLLEFFPESLRSALLDPLVTDICINGPLHIYAETQNRSFHPILSPWKNSTHPDAEMKKWVIDLLTRIGKSWDAKNPFIDAALPTGHRLHIAFPPIASPGILISIRAHRPTQKNVHELKSRWAHCLNAFWLLQQALLHRENLLICGATGSGKTTLAQDLLSEIPEDERLILLEDTPEIQPAHPHWIALYTRPPNTDGYGEITLRSLLKQCLRMRPDRIVLGECRGAEVLDLLQALHTGHPGSLTTLHANSARDGLRRLEMLASLSGVTLPRPLFLDLVAYGLQWIAFTERNTSGKRVISEIHRIEGREGDTILLRPVIQRP